jgi:hypothetical protein
MVRQLIYSLATLVITLSTCFGQTMDAKGRSQTSSTAQQEKERQIETFGLMLPAYRSLVDPHPPGGLPLTAGAWILEVETIGGLTGGRKAYALLTSDGDFTVEHLELYGRLKLTDELAEFETLIKHARPAEWNKSSKDVSMSSLCQDCYKIDLTLYRRESDGTTSGYRAHWDEPATARLVKEVGDIFAAFERIKRRALEPAKKS